MRPLALAAFALLLAAPALAQATASDHDASAVVLRPGHPDLRTAALTLGDETVRLRLTEPRARDLGTVATTVARDGDTVTMQTAAAAPQAGQAYESTVTFAFPSLAPIARERSDDGSRGLTRYDGATVTGEYGRGDWAALPFDITLEQAVFQPEVLPLIARALPFTAGYAAVVPTFTSETRVRDYTLTVIGPEAFTRADSSAVATWAVEQTVQARGARPVRYYVDAATRALVATTTAAGRGGGLVVGEPASEGPADDAPAVALRPGGGVLATDALASYTQAFAIRVVEPIQQDAGTMTRALTVDEAAGTVTLSATTVIAVAGQQTSETLVAAYPSLAPLSNRTTANGTVVAFDFSDGALSGTRTPADGEAEALDLALEAPVYDASWLFEIVRLLPFTEGFRGTFHTVSPGDGPIEVTLAVLEQAEVQGRTAWLVEAQPAEGAPTEFAVDAETRALLRIRLLPQPGVIVDIVPATEGE